MKFRKYIISALFSYMPLAERVTNGSETFGRYSNDHINCDGNNYTFKRMPNVWKGYFEP